LLEPSQNFIGVFLEAGIPKIYQFRPLLMALGFVGIGFGIKTEFYGKWYNGCTKSHGMREHHLVSLKLEFKFF